MSGAGWPPTSLMEISSLLFPYLTNANLSSSSDRRGETVKMMIKNEITILF
jgi:hypothetical protein